MITPNAPSRKLTRPERLRRSRYFSLDSSLTERTGTTDGVSRASASASSAFCAWLTAKRSRSWMISSALW